MPGPVLSAATRYCFAHPVSPHIVGRGLAPSAGRRGRRPLQRWPDTIPPPAHTRARPRRPEGRPPYNLPLPATRRGGIHPSRAPSDQYPLTLPLPRRGRACPARNLPTACRQSSTTPIICTPPTPHHHNIHLAQTSLLNFVEKIKKTCKNLLTKVMPVAIIIKLSREPSPRRQPLKPLPTACTPFFEENFFKKLSENLLTNERI